MQKTLLVDMDGTLVDSLPDLAASVNHALAHLGRPARSEQEVRSFVGNGAAALLVRCLGDAAGPEVQDALAHFFEHYEAHLLDHTRLYAGWEQVFATGVELVCATNKPERFAKRILAGLGVDSRFALLVGGDTLPFKKPDAGVATHIAATLAKNPADFVMVGDGVPDGALAKACGIPFWGARWGYEEEASLAPYAPVWLDGPADILSLVQG